MAGLFSGYVPSVESVLLSDWRPDLHASSIEVFVFSMDHFIPRVPNVAISQSERRGLAENLLRQCRRI